MANEKHLLLTWGGSYTSSEDSTEVWANTLRFNVQNSTIDDVGTLPNDWSVVNASVNRTETHYTIVGNWRVDFGAGLFMNVDDWLDDQVAPALDTWTGQSGISDDLRLDWIKVFPIGASTTPPGKSIPAPGQSQGSPMLLSYTSSNPTGDDGANLLPLQNALVASHLTNVTGRKGRGRVFRAGLSANANDTKGMVPSTIQGYLKDAEISLLEALGTDLGLTGDIKVRPCVIGSPWTSYGVITSVRVGNRIDTQRRRRNAVPESYSSGAVSY